MTIFSAEQTYLSAFRGGLLVDLVWLSEMLLDPLATFLLVSGLFRVERVLVKNLKPGIFESPSHTLLNKFVDSKHRVSKTLLLHQDR
ncbi:hypothetical protein BpHYR1_024990 [Brachionus plicatilis]|uniref:Uncharacterized protein n=1 Tax=Brachionus plicatilis TaxID=10195 RepID=A0A3M7RVN3_BRAPC|nr:hypothetical protein BpHYR1_024990 [Brachionus plicatilis]